MKYSPLTVPPLLNCREMMPLSATVVLGLVLLSW